jgi:hypothetical protein
MESDINKKLDEIYESSIFIERQLVSRIGLIQFSIIIYIKFYIYKTITIHFMNYLIDLD